MELSIEDVREIVAAYLASEVDSLTLDTPGFSIALSRTGADVGRAPTRPESPVAVMAAASAVTAPVSDVVVPVGGGEAQEPSAPSAVALEGTVAVTAPTVGVFYRRPAPNEAPFVEVGDVVDADATVCIIDVMKLFNKVPAGVSGRIVEICVKDGELVEHGQTIMRIAP